jgi:hypothetical protein
MRTRAWPPYFSAVAVKSPSMRFWPPLVTMPPGSRFGPVDLRWPREALNLASMPNKLALPEQAPRFIETMDCLLVSTREVGQWNDPKRKRLGVGAKQTPSN